MNTRNQKITRSTFCPVCERKFSGNKTQVSKLMKMHIKANHSDLNISVINGELNTHHTYNNERLKTDLEIKETVDRLI